MCREPVANIVRKILHPVRKSKTLVVLKTYSRKVETKGGYTTIGEEEACLTDLNYNKFLDKALHTIQSKVQDLYFFVRQ